MLNKKLILKISPSLFWQSHPFGKEKGGVEFEFPIKSIKIIIFQRNFISKLFWTPLGKAGKS
jgi:hypothetical protein